MICFQKMWNVPNPAMKMCSFRGISVVSREWKFEQLLFSKQLQIDKKMAACVKLRLKPQNEVLWLSGSELKQIQCLSIIWAMSLENLSSIVPCMILPSYAQL